MGGQLSLKYQNCLNTSGRYIRFLLIVLFVPFSSQQVTKSTEIVAADLIRDPDESKGRGAFKYMFALGLVATVAVSILWYGGHLEQKATQ